MKLDGLSIANQLANKRNGKCLSNNYKSVNNYLIWQCEFNHSWEATLHSVKVNNTWCPKCNIINMSHSLELAHKLANKKDGKCLSTEYVNNYTKLLWECKNKHQWLAPLHNIKDFDRWCAKCSGKAKLSLETAIKVANDKDGYCLSDKYIDNKTPLIWKCKIGHIWSAALNDTKNRGTWCPFCRKNYKKQNILRDGLEDILKIKSLINFREFDWLKNSKTGMLLEIDIWFPELKLAVEYDGEQHFKEIKFFGGKDRLILSKQRDEEKNKIIKKHKNEIKYFIRFNYKDDIKNLDFLKEKLKQIGIK